MPPSRSPSLSSALPRLFCVIAQSSGTCARVFPQRVAIGRDRLVEPRRAALALAEPPQRKAEIVLGHRPVERHALKRQLLKRLAIGRDRLVESWSRSSEQFFRVDKWSLCRG